VTQLGPGAAPYLVEEIKLAAANAAEERAQQQKVVDWVAHAARHLYGVHASIPVSAHLYVPTPNARIGRGGRAHRVLVTVQVCACVWVAAGAWALRNVRGGKYV
jgi:hypothetical protein